MVSQVNTIALNGIAATPVTVQVQLTSGNPNIIIVGLPANSVKESHERVRGAFHAIGLRLPAKRITVNLAPADLAKEGSHFDLPIAVAMLMATGILPNDAGERTMFMGEIGLDGNLNKVTGCLPAAINAQNQGCSQIFVPQPNGNEAAWAGNIDVFGINNLQEIIKHITGEEILTPVKPTKNATSNPMPHLDIADIKGQETAKRAAEIAAAGGHNLLMSGTPGSGKSMLAQRMPALMPPLTAKEALEVSMIHSVAGALSEEGLITNRPFRDPHHSASAVALAGGGIKAQPGEMSLSHRGILFLDELPEFNRVALETLRQPLETGTITISRANKHVTYPARFQLIAAMNPCPCGSLGDPKKQCRKAPICAEQYQSRLSGPLLDRIDLHVNVPPVKIKDLDIPRATEGTKEIAARVAAARTLQQTRLQNQKVTCNAELQGKQLEEICEPTPEGRTLLQNAAEKFGLSARAYHRTLKVARTIADLNQEQKVQKNHLAEALGFRQI